MQGGRSAMGDHHSFSNYRPNFGPESIEELKNNISSTHGDFLQQDDPDKKSDALRYMSGIK